MWLAQQICFAFQFVENESSMYGKVVRIAGKVSIWNAIESKSTFESFRFMFQLISRSLEEKEKIYKWIELVSFHRKLNHFKWNSKAKQIVRGNKFVFLNILTDTKHKVIYSFENERISFFIRLFVLIYTYETYTTYTINKLNIMNINVIVRITGWLYTWWMYSYYIKINGVLDISDGKILVVFFSFLNIAVK